MFENLHEECGVFGIFDTVRRDVARSTYFALYALQHRGQESCGIAVNDGGIVTCHADSGLVPEVFSSEVLDKLGKGTMAVGHVRYSTADNNGRINAQPIAVRHMKGPMVIAHNGCLTNSAELREEYELKGGIFHTTNDTEIIAYTITEARLNSASIEEAVEKAMHKLAGAYAIVVMSPQKLIAARDKNGLKPLVMGKTPDGAYLFASESCAIQSIGGEVIRDLLPGEIVVVSKDGVNSIKTHVKNECNLCVFEYVYFARPDSIMEGVSVHEARRMAGRFLARSAPVDADVVIGVPDSGLDAALGYAEESGIPYGTGFLKNKYVGRSFIQPTQDAREDAVRIKLNVISSVVKGKRVVMIDDSIVRGTTCGRIVGLLRDAGAKEVHVRISSPPFVHPCYFGTDIDSTDKLIACRMSHDEITKYINADSLAYLALEDVKNIAKNDKCNYCVGCFSGEYPVAVPKKRYTDKFNVKIGEF